MNEGSTFRQGTHEGYKMWPGGFFVLNGLFLVLETLEFCSKVCNLNLQLELGDEILLQHVP